MKKHSFKVLCWNVWENCLVDVVIDMGGYQSKNNWNKTSVRIFFVLFTRPVSPSGIYDTLVLLMLLTTPAKRKHYSWLLTIF